MKRCKKVKRAHTGNSVRPAFKIGERRTVGGGGGGRGLKHGMSAAKIINLARAGQNKH